MRVIVGIHRVMRRHLPVKSLRDASSQVCAFRDRSGMGASEMCRGFGAVVDEDENVVARVSYNGRVQRAEPGLTLDALLANPNAGTFSWVEGAELAVPF